MTTSAWILMISVWTLIISLTVYFFVKVLKTPKRPEPDSFSKNDKDLKH